MECKCVSCEIARGLWDGKIPKGLSDVFLLGYYYRAMTHEKNTDDDGWYEEGVEFYINEILSKDYPSQGQVKTLMKIIKNAKEI